MPRYRDPFGMIPGHYRPAPKISHRPVEVTIYRNSRGGWQKPLIWKGVAAHNEFEKAAKRGGRYMDYDMGSAKPL